MGANTMNRKANTMQLSGNDYAKVPERLKLFRGDCPNGSIKTTPMPQEDGSMIFNVYILKDKSKPSSGDSTGTSRYSAEEMKKPKAFEKLETIAVGRALALLGYLASGEIASSEEMEEFNQYKEDRLKESILEAKQRIEDTKTIDELKDVFIGLGNLIADEAIIEAKNKRKN